MARALTIIYALFLAREDIFVALSMFTTPTNVPNVRVPVSRLRFVVQRCLPADLSALQPERKSGAICHANKRETTPAQVELLVMVRFDFRLVIFSSALPSRKHVI